MKRNESYLAPTTEVLELKFEGIVCESGDMDTTANRQDYGDPNYMDL